MRVAEKAALSLDSNSGPCSNPRQPGPPSERQMRKPRNFSASDAHHSLTTVVPLYSLSAPIALMDTPPHKKQKVSDFVEAKPAAWTDSDDANLQAERLKVKVVHSVRAAAAGGWIDTIIFELIDNATCD